MKIICIGRNYAEHRKELGTEMPSKPLFFCKPDTALLLNGRPFYIPDFSNDIQYETEVVIKIAKVGKHIDPKFAHLYYEEIGLGFDFTARDIQKECIKKGLPWEICKGFDYSAALGSFLPKAELPPIQELNFSMYKNGILCQEGNTQNMLFSVDYLIAYVSQFMTLKIGDYLFTGTPSGVSSLHIGDKLEAFLEEKCLLRCNVR